MATKMKWYICVVPCTLENFKKKRNQVLKSGKTKVAAGKTQPIADFVDDRPHDIEYIDYIYQDFPGMGGAKAPAHLVKYYQAKNIRETNYAEAPPAGMPLHVLDAQGQCDDDETLYMAGFDTSGFPLFFNGGEYIKEKKSFLDYHKGTGGTNPNKYFQDLITKPADKNYFARQDPSNDALWKTYKYFIINDTTKTYASSTWSKWVGRLNFARYTITLKPDHRDKSESEIKNIFMPNGKIKLVARKVNDNYYLFHTHGGAAMYDPVKEADYKMYRDDRLDLRIRADDHRGLMDFWDLMGPLRDVKGKGLTRANYEKFKSIVEKLGYECTAVTGLDEGTLIERDVMTADLNISKMGQIDDMKRFVRVFTRIQGRVRGWPIVKTHSVGKSERRRGVWHADRTLTLYISTEHFLSAYALDARMLLRRYIDKFFPADKPRLPKSLLNIRHIVEEADPAKLITHRMLEQAHTQTRRKPYIPKNPVTYNPAVHVDEATHAKLSHNIHDAVMKKTGKTSYTYGQHKPKDSKKIHLEPLEVAAIMKPAKEAQKKSTDAQTKMTIWDL